MRPGQLQRLRTYRLAAWEEQGRKCFYCKEPLSYGETTADHKRPRMSGGRVTPVNIAAACLPCNQAKGALFAAQFFAIITRRTPPIHNSAYLSAWVRRRIWVKTDKACKRLARKCGLEAA